MLVIYHFIYIYIYIYNIYMYTPYEGASLANQNARKLGAFDQKLEGRH